MAPIIVGYWRIRALAQPIRLLLGYKKVDFVDKFHEVGDAPFFDKSDWLKAKPALCLDFPNLPYLIDGDVKLSQSNAIMRYLARKYDLCGRTEEEYRRIDLLENQLGDMRSAYWQLTYYSSPQHFASSLKNFKESVQSSFELLDTFLGVDRNYFVGERLTFVDFLVYEVLDQHRLLPCDNILKSWTNLLRFLKNFEEIPEMKEFMASDKFFKGPINNKYSLFKGPVTE